MKELLSLPLMAILLALPACTSKATTPVRPTVKPAPVSTPTPAPTETRPATAARASSTLPPIPTAIRTATPQPAPIAPDAVQKLSERRRLTLEGSFPIGDLAWTPGGMYLVLAMPTEKGEPLLRWYDTRTLSPAAAPTEIRGSHVAFSPDGKLMATAWSDLRDHLEIRRTADWTVSQRVGGQFYGIHALAFSPDGRLLAMANGSAQVRLLEVKSGLVLYELKVPCQGVHAPLLQDVAFSPDGKLVAGAAYGGTVQVWRTPDGSPVTTVQTGATQPNAVAFLDAGRFVTTGFPLANVWQIDGTLQTKLDGRDKPLDIAVSPDGRVLVTVERFQMLFWDVAGRRMVHRIESDEPLRALRLSPDGAALATIGGRDGRTIRVWGVERGAWGDGTRTTQHAARGDVKRVA